MGTFRSTHIFRLFLLVCLTLLSQPILADQNFVAGHYKDASGNQYLVSGPTPNGAGRGQWTIELTAPASGSNSVFYAIWETGPAVGNTLLSGDIGPTAYPSSYTSANAYGVVSLNNFQSWRKGGTLSASQHGTALTLSLLRYGKVAASTTLTYVSSGVNVTSASTTALKAGIYRDAAGKQYQVSGPTPSGAGRSQWTIRALTGSAPGAYGVPNSVWETGAAAGNTFLIDNYDVANYPANYSATRLYGVTVSSQQNISSEPIAISQVGNLLMYWQLKSDGSIADSRPLDYVSPGNNVTSASTVDFRPGIYQDSLGHQFQLSGPTPGSTNRDFWTIEPVGAMPGSDWFYGMWESGAAVGNTLFIGDKFPQTHPSGYPANRMYGLVGSTDWCCSWGTGQQIALAQVGDVLTVSSIDVYGRLSALRMLHYVSTGTNTTTSSTTSITPGNYEDGDGQQYLVSQPTVGQNSRKQWKIDALAAGPNAANVFSATLDSGAAIGNPLINGDPTNQPAGYPSDRDYGTVDASNWSPAVDWQSGRNVSALQAGDLLMLSSVDYNGQELDMRMLRKVPANELVMAAISPFSTLVGSTSAAENVTLMNTGDTPLTISQVTVPGAFTAANGCGSSVPAGAKCMITVTFKPTATGVAKGTLTVTDTATNSPQVLSLTGVGKMPVDSDGDGLADALGNGPNDPNEWQDTDGDTIASYTPTQLTPSQKIALPVIGQSLTASDGTPLMVPKNATAVALNVTAVKPDGSGYITVWPCSVARPVTSNLNYVGGEIVANGVIAPIGSGGKVCFYSSAKTDLVVDISGFFGGTAFNGLTPLRLVDTRNGTGVPKAKITPQSPLRVTIVDVNAKTAAGNQVTLPSFINAAALNVTVINPAAQGYLTVYPCGASRPLSSNLNFAKGQTVANGVIAPVSSMGQVCIYSSTDTDIVVDLEGWFGNGGFTGATPQRLVDTRKGTGARIGKIGGSDQLSVAIAGQMLTVNGSSQALPASASAAALNVTAVNPAGGGYITVYPCGVNRPVASSLNYTKGAVVANNVIAPLGGNGNVCVYSSTGSDVVVDISGWFGANPSDGFVGTTPYRLIDTRKGLGPPPT